MYLAVGYALANSIMIEGEEGIVIVDVTESYESGVEVFQAFRNITKKPVTDIIYTHNHADHCYGAEVSHVLSLRTQVILDFKQGFYIPGKLCMDRLLTAVTSQSTTTCIAFPSEHRQA